MKTINDVHHQFAEYFGSGKLKPHAYLLSRRLSEGHICLPLSDISIEEQQRVVEIFKIQPALPDELRDEPLVQFGEGAKQPFVIHNDKMYLQRYFHYETVILEKLRAFVAREAEVFEERTAFLNSQKKFVEELFKMKSVNVEEGVDCTDWQKAAAITAILNNFTIITGGPGTGKTTTVAKILALLLQADPGMKVALAAPTGKAATRMAESLKNADLPSAAAFKDQSAGFIPATIHRLLKSTRGSHHFRHNSHNPLPYDVIIIDESSMIDTALFAKLLDAIDPKTRLILLGDKDQLASVEAGSLFGDLCKALHPLNVFSDKRIAFINSFISETEKKISKNHVGHIMITLFLNTLWN